MPEIHIPDADVKTIQDWVAQRNAKIPEEVRDQVMNEVDIEGRDARIFECRPPWSPEFGTEWTRQETARIRYFRSRGFWKLYWPDRNSDFHLYESESGDFFFWDVREALAEIENDPYAIFWG